MLCAINRMFILAARLDGFSFNDAAKLIRSRIVPAEIATTSAIVYVISKLFLEFKSESTFASVLYNSQPFTMINWR